MWGMSYANIIMLNASIPNYDLNNNDEGEVDLDNWQKYVSA